MAMKPYAIYGVERSQIKYFPNLRKADNYILKMKNKDKENEDYYHYKVIKHESMVDY